MKKLTLSKAKGKKAQTVAAGPSLHPGSTQQPNADEPFRLVCWTYGISRKGLLFFIQKDKTVAELKMDIKNRQRALKDVDEDWMDLWKVNLPYDEATIKEAVDQYQFDGGSQLPLLRKLSDEFEGRPADGLLHIIMRVATREEPAPPNLPELQPVEFQDVDPITVLELRDHEDINQLSRDHLFLNNVIDVSVVPLPLEDFRHDLQQQRHVPIALKNYVELLRGITNSSLDTYFRIYEGDPPADTNRFDLVTANEFTHYISLFGSSQLLKLRNYTENKESQVRSVFLNVLEMINSIPAEWGFRTQWPFRLVIHTTNNNRYYQYTPMSDFHMRIENFPHLIVEVISHYTERDRYCLLLQAAYLARIGNKLRQQQGQDAKPVIIMAIYIDNQFTAFQYLVYQPDTSRTNVSYVTKQFDLTDSQDAMQFIFELYNFPSLAKRENNNLQDPARRLFNAKEIVGTHNLPSLFSSTKKRKRDNHTSSDGRRQPGPSGTKEGRENLSLHEELAAAGYEVTETIVGGLELLTPLKPTTRPATSQSGASVILKDLDDDTELKFLEYFSKIKSPQNRVIPLVDVINLKIGKKVMVLPWEIPLDEVLRFHGRTIDAVSLCAQFIQGVAFLHENKVAHCDLKPSNIVVDAKRQQVYIIDFDLAEFVEDEDTMVEGWCGTPPWIAPEVGKKDDPVQRRYSPILADRWVCGKMVKYFAEYTASHKQDLDALAERLMNNNPKARPSLSGLKVDGRRKRRWEGGEDHPLLKRSS